MSRASKAAARDFSVANHGSIALLTPQTPEARSWVDEHLPEDVMTFGGGIVVEPRYLDGILEGITIDGLSLGGGH